MIQKIIKRIKGGIRCVLRPKYVDSQGVKINVAHEAISNEIKKSIYFDAYEGEEVSILEKHLEQNDKVLELGAGLGFLSTYCSQKVGSENVIAYEANPSLIPLIKETYELNGVSPVLRNELLHDGEKNIEFYVENHFWASSMVQRSPDAKLINIKSININEEIKRLNPTFIIMDIEGGEKEILPLVEFLNIKKMIVELHPHVIGEDTVSALRNLIISKGFILNNHETKGNVYFFER